MKHLSFAQNDYQIGVTHCDIPSFFYSFTPAMYIANITSNKI